MKLELTDQDKARLKGMWPYAMYAAVAIVGVYVVVKFLTEISHFFGGVVGVDLGRFGMVLTYVAVTGVFSHYFAKFTMKMVAGKHAESITPLASMFSKMERLFDKEFDENPSWVEAHLRVLESSSKVVASRNHLYGMLYFSYMLLFGLLITSVW